MPFAALQRHVRFHGFSGAEGEGAGDGQSRGGADPDHGGVVGFDIVGAVQVGFDRREVIQWCVRRRSSMRWRWHAPGDWWPRRPPRRRRRCCACRPSVNACNRPGRGPSGRWRRCPAACRSHPPRAVPRWPAARGIPGSGNRSGRCARLRRRHLQPVEVGKGRDRWLLQIQVRVVGGRPAPSGAWVWMGVATIMRSSAGVAARSSSRLGKTAVSGEGRQVREDSDRQQPRGSTTPVACRRSRLRRWCVPKPWTPTSATLAADVAGSLRSSGTGSDRVPMALLFCRRDFCPRTLLSPKAGVTSVSVQEIAGPHQPGPGPFLADISLGRRPRQAHGKRFPKYWWQQHNPAVPDICNDSKIALTAAAKASKFSRNRLLR